MATYRRFENQHGLISPDKLAIPTTVIGAGAIGSFFTLNYAKMGGSKIAVYDDDTIEEHNIANQMYPEMFVGSVKVDALKIVVGQYSGVDIVPHKKKWEVTDPITDAMIVAVDNMDVRKTIWDAVKTRGGCKHFLDGRMGAEVLRAYCIDMGDASEVEFYEKTLYSAKEAVQEPCAAKSIIYTVLLAAGILNNLLKRTLNEEKRPTEIVYDAVNSIQVTTHKKLQKILPQGAVEAIAG